MTYFSGKVNNIVYEDPSKAFYIVKMVLDDKETSWQGVALKAVTVRGYVPGIPVKIGTWFGFQAKWEEHDKYGRQLAISKAPVMEGVWDPDTVEKMLSANGVGERVCMRLRTHFDDKEFIEALSDEDKLQEVPGIAKFAALHIVQRWQVIQAYFKALDFLTNLKLPPGKVAQIWSTFGDNTEKILSTNPWALVQVDGVSFQHADEVAARMGLPMDNPERTKGAVLWAVKNQKSMGHLYMVSGEIADVVNEYITDSDAGSIGRALVSLHKENFLVLDRKTRPGTMAVYEPWFHKMEVESSSDLVDREETAAFKAGEVVTAYLERLKSVGPRTEAAADRGGLHETVKEAVAEWGSAAHLELSPDQQQGVANALSEPVSILTGLPGTGKTTSLRAVVRILQEASVPFLLCAPTGIAAKNLSARAKARAYTIHRSLGAKGFSTDQRDFTYAGVTGDSSGGMGESGSGEMWGFGPGKYYPAEAVVVDEASMVDQHLLYRLLQCTSPTCRLVFVGDAAQLPSVGPGNVLRDLIASGKFPTVNLTQIFRQEETSDIVYAAHDVFNGNIPNTKSSDFTLVEADDDSRVLEIILALGRKLYDKRKNFQILSPRHTGTVGVTNLNARLRELLNPKHVGSQEVRLGNDAIREDDRIMVVKNDYRLEVFNGDVGKVKRIIRKEKIIEIKVFGNPERVVPISFRDAPRLIRLAYACTVHKAQGLEYDVIVMPLVTSFRHQLQRNLLYTAITRAKTKVVLVGSQQALGRAVINDREDSRNTLFLDRLSG